LGGGSGRCLQKKRGGKSSLRKNFCGEQGPVLTEKMSIRGRAPHLPPGTGLRGGNRFTEKVKKGETWKSWGKPGGGGGKGARRNGRGGLIFLGGTRLFCHKRGKHEKKRERSGFHRPKRRTKGLPTRGGKGGGERKLVTGKTFQCVGKNSDVGLIKVKKKEKS